MAGLSAIARPFAGIRARLGGADLPRIAGLVVATGAWVALAVGVAILGYQLFQKATLSYWPPVRLQDVALMLDLYLPLPDVLMNLPLFALLIPPSIVILFLHAEWSSARYRRLGKAHKTRAER